MEQIKLKADIRELTGKKVKNLRSNKLIPSILYGQGDKAVNLVINEKDFQKAFKVAGSSSLIDLEIANQKPIKVLIKKIQYHPVSDFVIHIDLYKVKMDETITTNIPFNFIGEAPAVKELEGNLIVNKDSLEIECLPNDLVHQFDIDISVLKTFDDAIHVRDIKLPTNIKILDDLDEVITLVTPPRSEEELEAMESEAAADSEKAQIEKLEAESEAEKTVEGEGKTEDGEGKEEEKKEENK